MCSSDLLTAIKGFVETLIGGAMENPEEARRFLGIIETHANRLAAIIEDLMKLSEIEQKGQNRSIGLRLEAVKPVIQGAIEVLRPHAAAKVIPIRLECEEGLQAEINAHFLEQALVNLVENAIKYSGNGGTVRVRARQAGSEVEIRVEDEGDRKSVV